MGTSLPTQEQQPVSGKQPADADVSPQARSVGRAPVAVVAVTAACVGLSALFVAVAGKAPEAVPARAPAIPAPAAPASGTINVALTEFKVVAPSTLAPGQVTLHITNAGAIQHELLVFKSDLAPSAYPRAEGGIDEEGAGTAKVSDGDNLDPGTQQTRTVDLTHPGTYLFVCNLPGHYAAGMYQVVTVK